VKIIVSKLLKKAQILIMLSLLIGCETPTNTQRWPEVTFAHLPPITLDVANIQLVNKQRTSEKFSQIMYRLPISPAMGLRQWARDRLRSGGQSGSAQFIIQNISVTKTALIQDKSLKGVFTKQQSDRYDFQITANLEVISDLTGERGQAFASARRSITIREDLSLNDRERALFEAVNQLLQDFNNGMQTAIDKHLVAWTL